MSSSGIFGKLKMPAISRFRESAPGSGNGEMGIFRVALLGVALTVGGQVMFWNGGLHMGMGLLLLSHALFIGAYMTITCALAEMTSALPFGGGIYGYVRVTLGPFLGFIVGCCEMLQNVVYGCYCLYPVGHFISELFGLPHSYCSLFWIIMLLFALAINVAGPKYFWSSNVVVLVMAFTMMLLYYAVTFPCMDCEKYAGSGFIRDDANAGATDWFKYFPYAWWIFAGLEMLPMACSDAAEPKRTIPYALIIALAIVSVNGFLMIITTGCSSPGAFASAVLGDAENKYVEPVFSYRFHHSLEMTQRVAKALAIPALYASTSSFLFVYSKQLKSMAESGLFPAFLKKSYGSGSEKVPYAALIHGAVAMLLVVVISEGVGHIFLLGALTMASHATVIVDVAILAGFIIFRDKYAGLPKLFRSPFGLFGSIIGSFVMVLASVSTTVMFPDGYISFILIVLFLMLSTLYYTIRVRPHQGFSDEEQRVMFVAYVINANRRSKNNRRRHSQSERSVSMSIASFVTSPKERQSGRSQVSLASSGQHSGRSHVSEGSSRFSLFLGRGNGANVSVVASHPTTDAPTLSHSDSSTGRLGALGAIVRSLSTVFAPTADVKSKSSEDCDESSHPGHNSRHNSLTTTATGDISMRKPSMRVSVDPSINIGALPTVLSASCEGEKSPKLGGISIEDDVVSDEVFPPAESIYAATVIDNHVSVLEAHNGTPSNNLNTRIRRLSNDDAKSVESSDGEDAGHKHASRRNRNGLCLQSIDATDQKLWPVDLVQDADLEDQPSSNGLSRARRRSRADSGSLNSVASHTSKRDLVEAQITDLHSELQASIANIEQAAHSRQQSLHLSRSRKPGSHDYDQEASSKFSFRRFLRRSFEGSQGILRKSSDSDGGGEGTHAHDVGSPSFRKSIKDSSSTRWRHLVSDSVNMLSNMVPEFIVKDESFDEITEELVHTILAEHPEKQLELPVLHENSVSELSDVPLFRTTPRDSDSIVTAVNNLVAEDGRGRISAPSSSSTGVQGRSHSFRIGSTPKSPVNVASPRSLRVPTYGSTKVAPSS